MDSVDNKRPEPQAAAETPEYWRSLEQLAGDEDYQQWLDDEFPQRKSLLEMDRRSFLKVAGVGLAAAGLAGCRNTIPQKKLVPFVKMPEDVVPGKTVYYASAYPFGGYGLGILVESSEGRPTKIEGNPTHPMSRGATDPFTQAEVLTMYDPDRAESVVENGILSTWDSFLGKARGLMNEQRAKRGAGIRILSETSTSPTLARLIGDLIREFPEARWHQFEMLNRDNAFTGSQLAFGQQVNTVYHFDRARVVLSLDGDFLSGNPHNVGYIRDFTTPRDPEAGVGSYNRLYMVESTPTLTGAYADHRLAVKPSEVELVARAIASRLGVGGGAPALPEGVSEAWLNAAVSDLQGAGGGAVVLAGDGQPPAVHVLAHVINSALGSTVPEYVAPATGLEALDAATGVQTLTGSNPELQTQSLRDLVLAMEDRSVDVIFILGGNPVYSAPADIDFRNALAKVPNRVQLSLYQNETSEACNWNLPEAHFLEAWGDVRAIDGTVSVIQPVIKPLYEGRSAVELVAGLLNRTEMGYDLVRETWVQRLGGEKGWERALNDGVIRNSRLPALALTATPAVPAMTAPAGEGQFEAVFAPDPTIWDGRFANNGWLQELPKPITKLTWDNAVHISPRTASRLDLENEMKVKVSAGGRSVEAPVFIVPGHPDNTVTLHLGYGRTKAGKVGSGDEDHPVGWNFNVLRSADSPGFGVVTVERVGGKHPLASAQNHHSMEGRDLIRSGSLAEYGTNPSLAPEHAHPQDPPSLYNLTEEWEKKDESLPQWAMTIDLNTCVGCNACVVACQSENNIPTVGKMEVARGREMHWIRVDRYYKIAEGAGTRDIQTQRSNTEGVQPAVDSSALDANRVRTVFQPLPCMHCESAPCEPVCPVAATVHSHEGLNQMVYNRCVGTRYCSNNCPYKVRRFNYYNYQHGGNNLNYKYGNTNFQGEKDVPLLRLLNNPNVTVRSRGVMEKCTYCVQRINRARIEAKKEGRDLRDGEVVTACQQVCPANAIVFGNRKDPNSRVSQRKSTPRNYGILTELNTVPRTTYLAKVRNINSEIGF